MPGTQFISKEEMNTIYRSGHEAQIEAKSEEREWHLLKLKQLGIV